MRMTTRLRSIGWAMSLLICGAVFVALTMRVNAVRSEVRLAERQIVALEREKMMLETEFETRANQRQLADWNAVDFGYQAPDAGQFLGDARELAELGAPPALSAPDPLQTASRSDQASGPSTAETILSLVSPLTGEPFVEDTVAEDRVDDGSDEDAAPSESLGERLVRTDPIAEEIAESVQ